MGGLGGSKPTPAPGTFRYHSISVAAVLLGTDDWPSGRGQTDWVRRYTEAHRWVQ